MKVCQRRGEVQRRTTKMYTRLTNALHLLNILFQSLYSLAMPIGIGALASYLLTKHTSVGGWIWAVLLTGGVLMGLISMVKFVITSTSNLERLEKQREENRATIEEKERRQAALREEIKKNTDEGDINGKN